MEKRSRTDYNDLHIAVDFTANAVTCVFGKPVGTDLTGKKAVLVSCHSSIDVLPPAIIYAVFRAND